MPLPSTAQAPHVESVQHRTTTVTLVASEYEADVRVAAKQVEADGVVSLMLEEVGGHALPAWRAGAHVDLVLGDAPTRQYSLCGDPGERSSYRLGVLRDPNGRGSSRYVHDDLQVGDVVRVRGPRNNFALRPAASYLFVAGGIGITPILTMVAEAERAGVPWRLAYGGRRRASMAFLDELARYGDRVSVLPEDETGLLDLAGLIASAAPDAAVYCCGPEPLLRAVEEQCGTPGSPVLHLERFAPKDQGEPVLAEAFEVHLAQSDLTLTIPPDRSIISVAEEAGVGVMYSCSEGTCGTCETPVIEGVPDHRDSILTDDERASNACMMICVSRSCTPRLVLDL